MLRTLKKLFHFQTLLPNSSYSFVYGVFFFFLFKHQNQKKHWWEEKYMPQIKKDADSNLLHSAVSVAIVLHTQS